MFCCHGLHNLVGLQLNSLLITVLLGSKVNFLKKMFLANKQGGCLGAAQLATFSSLSCGTALRPLGSWFLPHAPCPAAGSQQVLLDTGLPSPQRGSPQCQRCSQSRSIFWLLAEVREETPQALTAGEGQRWWLRALGTSPRAARGESQGLSLPQG